MRIRSKALGRILVGTVAAGLGIVVSVPASSSPGRTGLPGLSTLGEAAEPTPKPQLIVVHTNPSSSSGARGGSVSSVVSTDTASTGFASPGAPARRIGPLPTAKLEAAGLRINTGRNSPGGSEQSRQTKDRIERHQAEVAERIAERRNR